MKINMQLISDDAYTVHWFHTDEPFGVVRKRIQDLLDRYYPESETRQDDHPEPDIEMPPSATFVFRLRLPAPDMETSLRNWNRMLKAVMGP